MGGFSCILQCNDRGTWFPDFYSSYLLATIDMLIWLLTSKSCDPSNSMTLACSSMYLDEIMFRLLRVQMGKLKSLCESFFKLKDIKVRLFVEEEVWIVTASRTIIVSYAYRKDLGLYLSCIKSCMMTTAFTGIGMPSTTTSGGGHGLSDGAWNWLGRDHCCGRRELASRLQRSQATIWRKLHFSCY